MAKDGVMIILVKPYKMTLCTISCEIVRYSLISVKLTELLYLLRLLSCGGHFDAEAKPLLSSPLAE